jgi:Family of unknown function (DUF6056)
MARLTDEVTTVSSAPPASRSSTRWVPALALNRVVLSVFGVALALPLAVYASVGAFARYTADDYCWAGILRTEGFWRAQVLWYTGYSPRYAFTFVVNLVELAGPAVVPVLPALAVVTWVATFAWMFRQFDLRFGDVPSALSAVLLAEALALAALQTAPDTGQSLYWQTGMLTYVLPLILATFFVGWVVRAARDAPSVGPGGAWPLLVSLGVTYVAGGLSETYLIPQNVALTLAALAVLVFWRGPVGRTALLHLLAGLAGGVLALASILLAPATEARVGGSPADLWLASSASIATAAYQALRLVRYYPFTVLLGLALPALIEALADETSTPPPTWRTPRAFVLVTACVALTLPFCYFPSFYAQNGNPPARSLIVPGSILIGYLIYVGLVAASLLARASQRLPSVPRAAAVVALVLVPLSTAVLTLPDRALAAQYAALWDAEDASIRAARDAGVRDLIVPPLPRNLGEQFVTTDPRHFFNVCVARYYGLDTIAAAAES